MYSLMIFYNIINIAPQHISRIILTVLILSNFFYVNNFYRDAYKKHNNYEAVLETAVINDINNTVQKTGKTQLQKLVKILQFELTDKLIFASKYTNYIKTPVQHFSLLNFQFFLSSQFSTGT